MGGYNTCINKNIVKKIVISIFIIYILFILFCPVNIAHADGARSSCVVIEQESGRVLYGSNIHAKLPMASTTKIMTALVVLQNMDIYSYITIPKNAIGIEGSSIYLKEGEKWRIIDLLYGLMLRSGNDAATALAIACGGSLEGFSKMMNESLINLGLNNSNFVNPHGLHDEDHYTTSYDLAMITREAFKYDIFREIVSSKVYKFTSIDKTFYIFHNKNKMLNSYEGANGVKTGYTKVAGRCLVSSAERGGMQLITVAINHPNMWGDSVDMMEKVFSEYKMYELIKKGEFVGECRVTNSKRRSTMLISKESINYPLSNRELSKIRYQFECTPLLAPVKADTHAGNLNIFLDNDLLFEVNAYTMEDVKDKSLRDRLSEISDKWRNDYEN